MHQCLFIICVIVYNLYYCCYAKTSSPAVQIRHSKVYGNPIVPSLYSILLVFTYLTLYTRMSEFPKIKQNHYGENHFSEQFCMTLFDCRLSSLANWHCKFGPLWSKLLAINTAIVHLYVKNNYKYKFFHDSIWLGVFFVNSRALYVLTYILFFLNSIISQ